MRWMLFVTGWSTGLAYSCGVFVYQAGQITTTPVSALSWIGGCVAFIMICLWRMRAYGKARDALRIPMTTID
jgi:ferrous iron transport protein B